MNSKIITPRTLKGFRDYLPETMLPREQLIATAQKVYRSFGYTPIETPALEYLEILGGKGGEETDKQMYHFQDHGGREVGMRFDLTIPLARFVAQHQHELGLPFKRYHIAPVWRGENTQKGRYREFMQCDFDTIGTTSLVADIEVVLVIDVLLRAIGIEKFTICVNNRKILNGILEKFELEGKSVAILRVLDKLTKIGVEKVLKELTEVLAVESVAANEIVKLITLKGDRKAILESLSPLLAGNKTGESGLAELWELTDRALAAGVAEERLKVDVSIARGLDYYTGTIYETFLDDLPDIGSVCSGGRYDNLAGLYTKERLPGVGASLGLDRFLAAMEQLALLPNAKKSAQVFLVNFEENRLSDYLLLAKQLRDQGLAVEFFPETKKIGQQLKYADRNRFPVAIVAGESELCEGKCQVKDLKTGESHVVSLANEAKEVAEIAEKIIAMGKGIG
ncbi:MAG: histidine--tRNA ligase [Pirellulaceae bacterium]|nr:histidine--tRNA ligase [Pirellulaceae bacterium]